MRQDNKCHNKHERRVVPTTDVRGFLPLLWCILQITLSRYISQTFIQLNTISFALLSRLYRMQKRDNVIPRTGFPSIFISYMLGLGTGAATDFKHIGCRKAVGILAHCQYIGGQYIGIVQAAAAEQSPGERVGRAETAPLG